MKLTLEEAKVMMDQNNNGNLDLRGTKITALLITGACEAGTESFVNSLKDLKDKYTVREVIEMTERQYGAEKFKAFFEGANE